MTTYDGRPIKLEGNPEHPINRGATSAIMQAAILDMYDPDRSTKPLQGGKDRSWEDFTTWAKTHFDGLASAHGSGLAFGLSYCAIVLIHTGLFSSSGRKTRVP